MAKRIHHMGMTLTKEEHDRFHDETRSLSSKQHDALMKKLGVTKEQDEEWHRTHLTLEEQRAKGAKALIGDEKRCEFCGSSSYGSGCLNSPTKKHRHGSGANKCRWCGSTSTGSGCLNSPTHNHER
jgi:hypothetical protein